MLVIPNRADKACDTSTIAGLDLSDKRAELDGRGGQKHGSLATSHGRQQGELVAAVEGSTQRNL
jgi:hypothetical protein